MTYSGFWRRAIAMSIDGFIMLIPSLVLGWLVPYVGGIVLALFYKPIFESSALKATPGKAAMGMSVVSEAGNRLTLKQAYIRYFCSLLSGFVLGIGYIMNLFTAKRQTLHDLIAETVVINQAPAEINYFQAWLSQIKIAFAWISGDAITVDSANSQSVSAANTASRPTESQVAEISKAIEELHKLYQSGILSESEYETKKQELLRKL